MKQNAKYLMKHLIFALNCSLHCKPLQNQKFHILDSLRTFELERISKKTQIQSLFLRCYELANFDPIRLMCTLQSIPQIITPNEANRKQDH